MRYCVTKFNLILVRKIHVPEDIMTFTLTLTGRMLYGVMNFNLIIVQNIQVPEEVINIQSGINTHES